jgi:hypothetical protein
VELVAFVADRLWSAAWNGRPSRLCRSSRHIGRPGVVGRPSLAALVGGRGFVGRRRRSARFGRPIARGAFVGGLAVGRPFVRRGWVSARPGWAAPVGRLGLGRPGWCQDRRRLLRIVLALGWLDGVNVCYAPGFYGTVHTGKRSVCTALPRLVATLPSRPVRRAAPQIPNSRAIGVSARFVNDWRPRRSSPSSSNQRHRVHRLRRATARNRSQLISTSRCS